MNLLEKHNWKRISFSEIKKNIKNKKQKTKNTSVSFLVLFWFVPNSPSYCVRVPPLPSFSLFLFEYIHNNILNSQYFPFKIQIPNSLLPFLLPSKWRIPRESSVSISRAASTLLLPPPPPSPFPPHLPDPSSTPIPPYHLLFLPMVPPPTLPPLLNPSPATFLDDGASGKRFADTGFVVCVWREKRAGFCISMIRLVCRFAGFLGCMESVVSRIVFINTPMKISRNVTCMYLYILLYICMYIYVIPSNLGCGLCEDWLLLFFVLKLSDYVRNYVLLKIFCLCCCFWLSWVFLF